MQLSFPRLMERLNGNIPFQLFCGIVIDPTHPLTNYKLLDDIAAELAGNLKIQQQQDLLARMWKPYMKDLDTMFTDAICYESEMRYPIDQKLLGDSWRHNYFRSGDSRESIPDRIVSVNKPYVRRIVRGKEVKNVEFGAKCNNIQVNDLLFVEISPSMPSAKGQDGRTATGHQLTDTEK